MLCDFATCLSAHLKFNLERNNIVLPLQSNEWKEWIIILSNEVAHLIKNEHINVKILTVQIACTQERCILAHAPKFSDYHLFKRISNHN